MNNYVFPNSHMIGDRTTANFARIAVNRLPIMKSGESFNNLHIGSGNCMLPFVDVALKGHHVMVNDLPKYAHLYEKPFYEMRAMLPEGLQKNIALNLFDVTQHWGDNVDADSVDYLTACNILNAFESNDTTGKELYNLYIAIFNAMKEGAWLTYTTHPREQIVEYVLSRFLKYFGNVKLSEPIEVCWWTFGSTMMMRQLLRKGSEL